MELRFILCAISKQDAMPARIACFNINTTLLIIKVQLYYWLSTKSSACFSKKWTQFLSSLERFFRNAAKAVVDLDRARPCKCVLHSFFDRKRRPGEEKKKNADVRPR